MNTTGTHSKFRAGMILSGCVLCAMAALWLVQSVTQERIQHTQHAWQTDSLLALLPEGPFDNDPLLSVQWLEAEGLGSRDPVPVYRVFRNQQPLAAVLTVASPDGYNGEIQLLLGIQYDGTIIGARVTQHQETPGLGDDIELRRSNWINGFTGLSVTTTQTQDWTVTQSGGQFDAFTGATITPRAVVHAIHRALLWFEHNRDRVFAV